MDAESANALAQVLGNGFFPVVMCAVLIIGIVYLVKFHKEEIESLTEIINKNTEAINKMSIVIQQLSDRVDALEKGGTKNDS